MKQIVKKKTLEMVKELMKNTSIYYYESRGIEFEYNVFVYTFKY